MTKPIYNTLTPEEQEEHPGAVDFRPSTKTYHRKDGFEVKVDTSPQPAQPWTTDSDPGDEA